VDGPGRVDETVPVDGSGPVDDTVPVDGVGAGIVPIVGAVPAANVGAGPVGGTLPGNRTVPIDGAAPARNAGTVLASGAARDARPAPRADTAGGGLVGTAGGETDRVVPAEGVRDVDGLVAALMRVECIADVDGFEDWFAELTRLSGRTVPLTSPWLAVRLTTLVSEAVRQPGPAMLDALVRALEVVAPRDDPAVAAFRRLVSEFVARRDSPASPGLGPTAPMSGFAPWPMGDGVAPPPVRGPAGAETYYFFTSHVHREDRDRVVMFHRELEAELRRKVRRRIEPAGFLDAERMGGGEHWPTALREAVRTAPVLVALWCDDYFESDWCGREFGVFQERIRRATRPGGKPPTGIIPVPWLVRETEVPPAASELHIARIDLGRKYDNMPVLDLMRHQSAFAEYVSLLAYRVMDVARDRLPALDADAADRVRSPFHPEP
jgi:hypothetical protein